MLLQSEGFPRLTKRFPTLFMYTFGAGCLDIAMSSSITSDLTCNESSQNE